MHGIKLVIEDLVEVGDSTNMTGSHRSFVLERLDVANDSHVVVRSIR